ncbi:MAG: hypothetical protein ACRELE_08515 [Gemmatimonadales bacterium]
MKRYEWLLGFASAGVIAVAGCTPNVDGPGYKLVQHGRGVFLLDSAEAADSATTFMLAAGCRVVERRPTAGTVIVPAPPAVRQLFACGSLSKDSTHHVVHSYMEHIKSWTLGAHIAAGYWAYDLTEVQSCSTGAIDIDFAPGPAHFVEITYPDGTRGDVLIEAGQTHYHYDDPFPTCTWMSGGDIYWVPAGDEPPPGPAPIPPGGSGAPPPPSTPVPPPPPPVPPPPVPDSVAYDNTGLPLYPNAYNDSDEPIIDCRHVVCPSPRTIISNRKVYQEAITIANLTNQNSLEYGVFVLLNSDGSYSFSAVVTGTSYSITMGPIPANAIATIHGHWNAGGPSPQDATFAKGNDINVVVGTPSGVYIIDTQGHAAYVVPRVK